MSTFHHPFIPLVALLVLGACQPAGAPQADAGPADAAREESGAGADAARRDRVVADALIGIDAARDAATSERVGVDAVSLPLADASTVDADPGDGAGADLDFADRVMASDEDAGQVARDGSVVDSATHDHNVSADTAPLDALATDATDITVPVASIWCELQAQARCNAEQSCPAPGAAAEVMDACLERTRRHCQGDLLPTMLALGWISFSTSQAETCLAAWSDLDCAAYNRAGRARDFAEGCAEVVAGQQGAGAACVSGFECRSAICRFDATCPGHCAELVDESESCGGDRVCAVGQASCRGGLCRALPATPGALCPEGSCAAPLVCNTEAPGVDAWRCVERGLLGEDCGPGTRICHPDLLCLRADLAGLGVCSVYRALGDSCHRSSDCLDGQGRALTCNGGTCLLAPEAGEPCADFTCEQAYCDVEATTPTCAALAAASETCAASSRCRPELYCDEETCVPRAAIGEGCASSSACVLGARCLASRCVEPGTAVCEPDDT